MTPADPTHTQGAPPGELTLLATGEDAFQEMLTCLAAARKSLFMRSFVWRDDETGNLFARRILEAADRGVQIVIHKDLMGAIYEHFDENKRSFFHETIDFKARAKVEFLCFVYFRGRPIPQTPNPLARRIVEHPGITIRHDRRLYDHSKVLIFDDETMIVGGMGIGNEFRAKWLDLMVRLNGRHHVERYRKRIDGKLPPEPSRPVGFLVNCWHRDGRRSFAILERRLKAIAETRDHLAMEMAYLGDARITEALTDLVQRGVKFTLILSSRTNIVHDLNMWVMNDLFRRTGGSDRLRVFLHPRMVHTKLMVYDDVTVQVGSTNCTWLSHDGYGETDLWVEDPDFARQLMAVINRHAAESIQVRNTVPTSRLYVSVEWFLAQWHRFGPGRAAVPAEGVTRIS
jgi:cardiolipin synthase